MASQEKCRIIDHQKVGPQHYKLVLASDYLSKHAQPGQFVQVKCSDTLDPLLRRPISLHQISPEHKTFALLYEVVGKGTNELTKLFVGENLDLFGPLGTGFQLDSQRNKHLLVGGGMGSAPLLALAERLTGQVSILLGAKTAANILAEADYNKLGHNVAVITDDGSKGKKGLVSDLLLERISQDSVVYACGPKSMLRAVAEICWQKKVDCQISMEERMACGIGACKGCAVKTKGGYKMACKDGPVFKGEDIIW
ncbi:hypothetical protein A2311_05565 [candidate division WOR-1 bacterium RIFOXYB2_FULL_48_7]|uniref:Dihydroorotate dehydrogenase B (NAD(+)), electron transfer subunit n=1 Tax=candidate division WOR-1 bacterium RIFOXYB2_FULL_48_7 TaxID=1802583 RepID=A0A1F4TPN9_UNCSA|nr:MAG: hypothetical protein A2311_05565 [candidate division WOR-1 bacterium RIFOXYB2_FULL_48_7]